MQTIIYAAGPSGEQFLAYKIHTAWPLLIFLTHCSLSEYKVDLLPPECCGSPDKHVQPSALKIWTVKNFLSSSKETVGANLLGFMLCNRDRCLQLQPKAVDHEIEHTFKE